MAPGTDFSTSVGALLEEYKTLRTEILARLDLQHKNMNVLVLLVSAITGFLVKYAADNGVSGAGETLVNNQIVTLVPLAALAINVFLWRHADHDVGIIDAASYLEQRLRPAIVGQLGPGQYLGFEEFLAKRRLARSRRPSRLVSLGNENVTMFLLLAVFIAAGWCVYLSGPESAGNAHGVFSVLLFLASTLSVFSLVIAFVVGAGYLGILLSPGVDGPAPNPAATATVAAGESEDAESGAPAADAPAP